MKWRFDITQRQAALWTLVIATIGAWSSLLVSLFGRSQESIALQASGAILFPLFLVIYLSKESLDQIVRRALIVAITGMLIMGLPPTYFTQQIPLVIFAPSLLAFLLLDASWIVFAGSATLIGLLIKTGGANTLTSPGHLVVYFACIIMLLVGSLVLRTGQRSLAALADQLRGALAESETQGAALVDANAQLGQQLEQQRQLLDLVQVLETPAIPLAPGVLCAPIVGHMDTRRAELLTARLLREAHERRMRLVVIDVTGVTLMDTAVTGALLNTAHALRLLGCSVTISGISATIALSLTHLGVQLTEVQTARDVQEALAQYMGTTAIGTVNTRN